MDVVRLSDSPGPNLSITFYNQALQPRQWCMFSEGK